MKRAWLLYQCCWLRIETIDNTHICMKRMKRSSLFILLYVIVPACNKDWERTRVCVEFKVGDGIKFHASDWSTQNDTWMKHCINHLLNSDQLPHTTSHGLVKGAILCFRNLYFYFLHGESTSTARQLTSPASQKSKDLNKVPLLLQDLVLHSKYQL